MWVLCGSCIPISWQSMTVPGWELAADTLLLAQCGAGMDGRMDRGSEGGRGLGRGGHNSSGFSHPPPECLKNS